MRPRRPHKRTNMIDLSQFGTAGPTPEQAGQLFWSEAQDVARNNGGDLIKGARTTRIRYPQIAALAGVSSPNTPGSKLAAPQIKYDDLAPLPIPSEDNVAAMLLPKDVDYNTFTKCWKANGSQCATVDHQSIFDALSESLRGRYSCSSDEADTRAAQCAPLLAVKVNSTAVARKMASQDPQPGAGFAPSKRPNVAPPPIGKPLSPAPRTGLDAFRPHSSAALGNDREGVALANSANDGLVFVGRAVSGESLYILNQ